MPSPRRLVIAGLGNYTHPLTRHSIGQVLLKGLALKAAAQPKARGSANLLLDKSLGSWISLVTLQEMSVTSTESLELFFCIPRAQMNVLGPAVVKSTDYFLAKTDSSYRLITIQDDLDLAPGTMKVQRGGGPRGHNGVRSVMRALPSATSRDFYRLRVGIGRPLERSQVASWVMGALSRDEVQSVSWDEDKGKGGAVLEQAWREILKIADEAEGASDPGPTS